MAVAKNGAKTPLLETLLRESSRRILHAMARPSAEADAAWVDAAVSEDRAACMLEGEGRELEAAIHRFSAASCFAKAGRYADAVPQARSALSFSLKKPHRLEIEDCLKKWIAKAKKQLRRAIREHVAAV